MIYTIEHLPEAITYLRELAELCKSEVLDYSNRQFNGVREDSLVFCLGRAIDMAEGCALAADAHLQQSLNTLTRSMFEGMIWTRWIMLSEANAHRFDEEVKYELARQVRKNVKNRYWRFVDEAARTEFEESAKGIPKRKRLEDVANEAGFARIYAADYGFYSMFAHGNPVRVKSNDEIDEGIIAGALAAIGFIESVRLMVRDWIVRRDQTTMVEIDKILSNPGYPISLC